MLKTSWRDGESTWRNEKGTLKLLYQEEDSLKQLWTCAEKEANDLRLAGQLDEAKRKEDRLSLTNLTASREERAG